MGQVQIPADALWGASTQRAVENFPISGLRFGRKFIRALGLIKWGAAVTNGELGILDEKLAGAIAEASQEVADGEHDGQFPLDIFQTGSGTSSNMNANEVIANRAIEILGGKRGTKDPVHPNDHVNKCQSSNDVIPTATHLAAIVAIKDELMPALSQLQESLAAKAVEFDGVYKSGRTHLMDATPVTLGQEFGGYASQVEHALARAAGTLPHLSELALGGTAVGTGLAAHAEFAGRVIDKISDVLGVPLREAPNHFEAQGARDAVVEASGALKTVAVSLSKICNDLRWMASGPRTGLGEILLPSLQPGSSIMPGKVNPVIPEAVIQVCAQVIGNDAAITQGGLGGAMELNLMMPMMAQNLISSIEILGAACRLLSEKCVKGIEADAERAALLLSRSLVTVTALIPIIGYDKAAEVSKVAYSSGKSLKDVLVEQGLMTESEADGALRVEGMTKPGLFLGDG